MFPHVSVLLNEWLEYLDGRTIRNYLDGTLGAGGHAEAVLKKHPEIRQFVGIDRDPQAMKIALERLAPWKDKIHYFAGNFSALDRSAKESGISKFDGILLDLGVSSMQLDQSERGFSFMREGPLDMRMDTTQTLTAEEVVNTWSESDLGRVLRDYGEEKQWSRMAQAIVQGRKEKPLKTTKDLAEVLQKVLPPRHKQKSGIHPLTLAFQGLRICVNGELEAVEKAIPKAIELLSPGGRLGVISFHSLEDRIVKTIFRDAASDKQDTSGLGGGLFLDKPSAVMILTRKPREATPDEIGKNPLSRSAKLRVVEKR